MVRAGFEQRSGALKQLRAEGRSDPEIGAAAGAVGMWLQSYRYFDAAEQCYAEAMLLAPSVVDWPYYGAQVATHLGRRDLARRHFERAVQLDPADAAALIRIGEIDQGEGDLDAARARMEDARRRDPASLLARVRLAQIRLAQGDPRATIELLAPLVGARRAHREIDYTLGQAYRSSGDAARARFHLGRAEGLESPDIPAGPRDRALAQLREGSLEHVNRGLALLGKGDAEAAVAAFEKAREVAPSSEGALQNLANAQLAAGRLDGAEASLRELVATYPESSEAHYLLSSLFLRTARVAEAEAEGRRAVELNPSWWAGHAHLARLLWLREHWAEALAEFGVAVEAAPGNVELRVEVVMRNVEAARFGEARRLLEDGVATAPEEPRLAMLLSRVLAASRDHHARDGHKALEVSRALFARHPLLGAAESMAMALAESGELEQATLWQEAALAAVRAAGREDELPWVSERLRLYRRGLPSRQVWAPGEIMANTGSIRPTPPASWGPGSGPGAGF